MQTRNSPYRIDRPLDRATDAGGAGASGLWSGRRLATGIALVVALLTVSTALAGAPTAAASVPHAVYRTDGQGLWLHSVPSIQDGLLIVLPEDAPFDVQCWTEGPDVNGNPIWLYGTSGADAGYVTDYYIDTTWNTTQDLTDQGIGHCGDPQPPAVEPQGPPTSHVSVPEPSQRPRPVQPRSAGTALTSFGAVQTACLALTTGWKPLAADMCRHYASASGELYQLDMGELIWRERPLWASLEWHLRNEVANASATLSRTPADTSATQAFDSGWQPYDATQGDYYWALHGFSFRVVGDFWIGPADTSGVRPVQTRYRSAMFDVYDFAPTGQFSALHDAASNGWAAEYLVTGDTVVRQYETTTANLDPWSLPFEW